MKTKILLLLGIMLMVGISAMAQKVPTKVIDNKGTIKWVLDSATAVITKADSTLLYVTPTQLNNTVKPIKDTINNISTTYIKAASNGLTKNGQTAELGGLLTKTTTIQTTATEFLRITGLTAGTTSTDSVVVVSPDGSLKFIPASTLFNALTFTNGLTKTGNTVRLGGALTQPTVIATDATNTLRVAGLQTGDLSTDSLVVAAPGGVLKRVTAASLLQSGETSISATTGTLTYAVADMPANPSRVWVYRNGAKLVGGSTSTVPSDYTVTPGNVTLVENGYTVTTGDIIEVQWVK